MTLLILITGAAAFAKNYSLMGAIEKKQAIISGSLNPAALSFNGQEIYQGKESYLGILLNDKEIQTTDVGGLKTFYTTTDSDTVELKWKLGNNETKSIAKFEYPALADMAYKKNEIKFEFNAAVQEAKIDSDAIQNGSYKVENLNKWLSESHTLELTSKEKNSQIYNLNFKNLRQEILTKKSWILKTSEAPFWANGHGTEPEAGIRSYDLNRISREFAMSGYSKSYAMGWSGPQVSNINQQAVTLKYRYGYNPFETNPDDFNYKRVTVGLVGEFTYYHRNSDTDTSVDGYFQKTVDHSFVRGGIFLRFEPYYYDNFGFFFNWDIRLYKSTSSIGSRDDNKGLGVSYNF
ncbi:MAG: hypothetical protein ACXWQQ_08295 [Pseudobdellovibrio sp.]